MTLNQRIKLERKIFKMRVAQIEIESVDRHFDFDRNINKSQKQIQNWLKTNFANDSSALPFFLFSSSSLLLFFLLLVLSLFQWWSKQIYRRDPTGMSPCLRLRLGLGLGHRLPFEFHNRQNRQNRQSRETKRRRRRRNPSRRLTRDERSMLSNRSRIIDRCILSEFVHGHQRNKRHVSIFFFYLISIFDIRIWILIWIEDEIRRNSSTNKINEKNRRGNTKCSTHQI